MAENNNFEENITWYYAMKMFVVGITCAAYIIYNFDDVQAINFATTTLLYFLPFSLDFLVRSTDTNKEKVQKRLGIIIPSAITFIFIIYVMIGGKYDWLLTMKISIFIKIIFSFTSLIFVKFAFDDFNNYTKNREKVTKKMKKMRLDINNEFAETMKDRMLEAKSKKTEGLKKVAKQAEKPSKNKRKKGK